MSIMTRHAARLPGAGYGGVPASLEVRGDLQLPPSRRRLLLLAPLGLVVSMWVVFQVMGGWLGPRPGFIAAFLVYWLAWGLAVPLWLVGRDGVAGLFRPVRPMKPVPRTLLAALLAAPAVFGFLFVFPSLFPDSEVNIIVLFAIYAIVNGVLEEIFWRGMFVQAFPGDVLRGIVYPALTFGVWHLVALSLSGMFPPVAPLAAFAAATILGLVYGWAARFSGSIRWVATSHALLNLAGIGAFVVFQPIG
jgi:membrane protease YdiL (CAAX protease family)